MWPGDDEEQRRLEFPRQLDEYMSADGRFHPLKVTNVWQDAVVDALTPEAVRQHNRPVHTWVLWREQEFLMAPQIHHAIEKLSVIWSLPNVVERANGRLRFAAGAVNRAPMQHATCVDLANIADLV